MAAALPLLQLIKLTAQSYRIVALAENVFHWHQWHQYGLWYPVWNASMSPHNEPLPIHWVWQHSGQWACQHIIVPPWCVFSYNNL